MKLTVKDYIDKVVSPENINQLPPKMVKYIQTEMPTVRHRKGFPMFVIHVDCMEYVANNFHVAARSYSSITNPNGSRQIKREYLVRDV